MSSTIIASEIALGSPLPNSNSNDSTQTCDSSKSNNELTTNNTSPLTPSNQSPREEGPVLEKYRVSLASYLYNQTTTISLNEINARFPPPPPPPSSLATPSQTSPTQRLIDIIRFDPENRFHMIGEGHSNNIRIKLNYKLTEEETLTLQNQWREQISNFLSNQNSAISLSDIGANVVKPFQLPITVKLLETLQTDLKERFILSGEGNNIRARRIYKVSHYVYFRLACIHSYYIIYTYTAYVFTNIYCLYELMIYINIRIYILFYKSR